MAYRRIKITVTRSAIDGCIIVHTDDPRLPELRITESAIYASTKTSGAAAIEYALRNYLQSLCVNYGYSSGDFDLTDVERYLYPYAPRYYAPAVSFQPPAMSPPPMSASMLRYLDGTLEPALALPVESPFEVNMMECLVGWKGWKVGEDRLLHSPNYRGIWQPDQAFEAECRNNYSIGTGSCEQVVREHHTCGIYATDKLEGAKSYGTVKGQVYGWGRYVRGDAGWRSQFAYPKSFHLTSEQVELVEPLKKYHVEIFIDQPLRIYDPTEEGYTHGHGQAEEDGNRGAAQGAPSGEARGSGGDAAGDED